MWVETGDLGACVERMYGMGRTAEVAGGSGGGIGGRGRGVDEDSGRAKRRVKENGEWM